MGWRVLSFWTAAATWLVVLTSCNGEGGKEDSTHGTSETTDTSTDTQCSDEPDFTGCRIATQPNRSYDLCVSGVCVSPGCGEASCNVPGPHFPLGDTNQRECYNESAVITCPNPGQDFYGQDAQYGWDASHPPSSRYTRTAAVIHQPIVTDTATGLVWQGCIAGLSGPLCSKDIDNTYSWNDALAYCDSLEWGNQKKWRLPDPYELMSIVNSGSEYPSIDLNAFPGTPIGSLWTSSTHADFSNTAWLVNFGLGYVSYLFKDSNLRVRCVRGGTFDSQRFETSHVSTDRMVEDQLTKLIWQGCPVGLWGQECTEGYESSYSWKQALSYCEGLSHGGHEDWRLPNLVELQSITHQRRTNPATDTKAFPRTPSLWFWSSSSLAQLQNLAWTVDFGYGLVLQETKSDSGSVRCVRAGL